MHIADGRPLLPVAPKHMAVLVQLPAPEGYFGNGCRLLRVSVPAGTPQPAAHDAAAAHAALCALAGAIRQATTAFRSDPEEPLKAIADTEALAAAPAPRMLAFLASKRRPLLTCSLNFVPAQPKVGGGEGWGGARLAGTLHGTWHLPTVAPAHRQGLMPFMPQAEPCAVHATVWALRFL